MPFKYKITNLDGVCNFPSIELKFIKICGRPYKTDPCCQFGVKGKPVKLEASLSIIRRVMVEAVLLKEHLPDPDVTPPAM